MNPGDEMIVEQSKTRLILVVVGALLFVATGVWMLRMDDATARSLAQGAELPGDIHAYGLVTVVFFGAVALFGIWRLMNSKPALILNSSGIIDNSAAITIGQVPWSDVITTAIVKVSGQSFVAIKIRNPEQYIARAPAVKRAVLSSTNGLCGSPFAIGGVVLKKNLPELQKLIEQYRQKYGENPAP